MAITTENMQLTKHQRYYRKNKERRLKESREWQNSHPISEYTRKRKYQLNKRRERIVNQLKELYEQ